MVWLDAGPNTEIHLILRSNAASPDSFLSTQTLAYWFSYFLSHSKHSSEEKTVLFTPQEFTFPSASSLLTPPSPPHPYNVTYTLRVRVTNRLVCLFPGVLQNVGQTPYSGLKNRANKRSSLHGTGLQSSFMAGKQRITQISGKNMKMLKCFHWILRSRKEEKVGKSCILRKMVPTFLQ